MSLTAVPNVFASRAGAVNVALLDANFAFLQTDQGSLAIGFKSPITGGVLRDINSRFVEYVSAFDTLTEAERLDVTAGTASLDVLTNLQKVFTGAAGKHLILPPGIYKTSDKITCTGAVPASISGWGAVLRNGSATVKNGLHIIGTGDAPCTITGLKFETTAAALYQSADPTLDLMKNYGLRLSLAAGTLIPCNNITVFMCHFAQCAGIVTEYIPGTTPGDYVYASQYKNIDISKCHFESTLTYNNATLYLNYITSSKIKDNYINNDTDAAGGIIVLGGAIGGWAFWNAVNNEITGNTVVVYRFGIFVGAVDDMLVDNNTLWHCNNEAYDFEGSKNWQCSNNKGYDLAYAFACFYQFANGAFINNQIVLSDDAVYCFNHAALTATDITTYGNLTFSGNIVACFGGIVLFQMSYCQLLTMQGNQLLNVVHVYAGDAYGQFMQFNLWVWTAVHPSLTYLFRVGQPDVNWQVGDHLTMTGNALIATTPLTPGSGCINHTCNSTFDASALIADNVFAGVDYSLMFLPTANANTHYRLAYERNRFIGGDVTSPFFVQGGNPCRSVKLDKLTDWTGNDWFGDEAAVAGAGISGCAYGSRIESTNLVSGTPQAWRNKHPTGGLDWLAEADFA